MDICEQIASTKVIDLAIRYALRVSKAALAKKLETIADAKSDSKDSKEEEEMENHQDDFISNGDSSINNQEDNEVFLPSIKKPEIEIKPLAMSQTLKRVNPFLKAGNSSLSPKGNNTDILNSKTFLLFILKIFTHFIILYNRFSWFEQFTRKTPETCQNCAC